MDNERQELDNAYAALQVVTGQRNAQDQLTRRSREELSRGLSSVAEVAVCDANLATLQKAYTAASERVTAAEKAYEEAIVAHARSAIRSHVDAAVIETRATIAEYAALRTQHGVYGKSEHDLIQPLIDGIGILRLRDDLFQSVKREFGPGEPNAGEVPMSALERRESRVRDLARR